MENSSTRPYSAPSIMTSPKQDETITSTSSYTAGSTNDYHKTQNVARSGAKQEEEREYLASKEYYDWYHGQGSQSAGERNIRLPKPTFDNVLGRSRDASQAAGGQVVGSSKGPSAGAFGHLQGLAALRVRRDKSRGSAVAAAAASSAKQRVQIEDVDDEDEDDDDQDASPDNLVDIGDLPEKYREAGRTSVAAPQQGESAAAEVPKATPHTHFVDPTAATATSDMVAVTGKSKTRIGEHSIPLPGSSQGGAAEAAAKVDPIVLNAVTKIQRTFRRFLHVSRAQRTLAVLHIVRYLTLIVSGGGSGKKGSPGSNKKGATAAAGSNLPSRLVRFLQRFSQVTDLASSENEGGSLLRTRALEALWGAQVGGNSATTLQTYFSQCVLEYEYKLQVENFALRGVFHLQEPAIRSWADQTDLPFDFLKLVVGRRAVLQTQELDDVLVTIYKASEGLSPADFCPLKSLVACPSTFGESKASTSSSLSATIVPHLDTLRILFLFGNGADVGVPVDDLGLPSDVVKRALEKQQRRVTSAAASSMKSTSSRVFDKENAPPATTNSSFGGGSFGPTPPPSSSSSSTPSSAADYEPYRVKEQIAQANKIEAALAESQPEPVTPASWFAGNLAEDAVTQAARKSTTELTPMPALGKDTKVPEMVNCGDNLIIPAAVSDFDREMQNRSPETLARDQELRQEVKEVLQEWGAGSLMEDVDSDDERIDAQRQAQMDKVAAVYRNDDDGEEEDDVDDSDNEPHKAKSAAAASVGGLGNEMGTSTMEDEADVATRKDKKKEKKPKKEVTVPLTTDQQLDCLLAPAESSELTKLWGLARPDVIEEEEAMMEEARDVFRQAVELPPRIEGAGGGSASGKSSINLNAGCMMLRQGQGNTGTCAICELGSGPDPEDKLHTCDHCGNSVHPGCAWEESGDRIYCERRCLPKK